MKSCASLLVWVIIGIISLFCFPERVFAAYSFVDDFNSFNKDSWMIAPEEVGSISIISNSFMRLNAVNNTKFPFLWKEIPVMDNFEIKFDFLVSGTPNFGADIILTDKIIDNGTPIGVDWKDIVFMISPNPDSGFSVNTVVCPMDNNACVTDSFNDTLFQGSSDSWNTFFMQKYGGKYFVYINGEKILESSISNKQIRYLWFGSPVKVWSVVWPTIDINNLTIKEENTNISTVIIPGLGASWDMGAMLTGNEGGNWQIPSFVKNYDGLISSFKNAGLVDTGSDKNLFIFSYDWRRPLSVLAERLNEYINANVPDTKINLIGHSMGGLVARTYAQTYGTSKINKIITIGSPNLGTVKAYGIWEGAMLFDDSWWSKVALELTTHFGVIAGESNIQTVQRTIPSLKDMLPTYNFLKFGDSFPTSISSVNTNNYLINLNNNVANINPLTTAIYSSDVQTDSQINVIPHSTGDLDTWIDGKPTDNPFIKTNGDGTVTDFSAKGPFNNVLQGTGWHGDLISKGENIQKIFSLINLDQTKALEGAQENFVGVLVAALRSPGKLEVCDVALAKCNTDLGGLYFSDNKLFMLPGYTNQDYIVRITETNELGDYSLHLGNIGNTSEWKVEKGKLGFAGQVDYYNLDNTQGHISLTLDKTGPSTPEVTGFHNPELSCGGSTKEHVATVDWTDSTDKNGVVGYEYEVNYPLGSGRGVWRTYFTSSSYRGTLNEGIHYIKVRAKDRFGNFSDWSNTCAITADWTSPVVKIISPEPTTYFSNKMPGLVYTATDNQDSNLDISNSGMSSSRGSHTVTVTATDNAGNIGVDAVSYTVQDPPINTDQCKRNGWRLLWFLRFRNQSDCVNYFERLERLRIEVLRQLSSWNWRR